MASPNAHESFAINESLFCHQESLQQIWLVGIINTRTNEFRVEIVLDRKSQIMEKIIKHYFPS